MSDDPKLAAIVAATGYSLPVAPTVYVPGMIQAAHAAAPPPQLKNYGQDAADFLAVEDSDEDPYIVAGLVPESMPTMIVGAPKARKSWVMLYLAVCIARGLPALGRATKRGRVLVIAREDTERETRRRLRLIARALGISPEDLRGWLRVDSTQTLYLDNQLDRAGLEATLAEFKPSVVFIDSLSRIHMQDENSKAEMARVMNAWSDLCKTHNCSVILLHHVVKWGDGGTLIQRIRGSGDIGAVLRVAIGVEKKDDHTSTIETDGNLADLALPFDVRITDLDASGRAIPPQHPTPGAARYMVRIEAASALDSHASEDTDVSGEIYGEIIDRLMHTHDLREKCTKSTLRRGLGSKDTVDAALAKLVRLGYVVAVMKGQKHDGYMITSKGIEFAGARPGPEPAPLGVGLLPAGLVAGLSS